MNLPIRPKARLQSHESLLGAIDASHSAMIRFTQELIAPQRIRDHKTLHIGRFVKTTLPLFDRNIAPIALFANPPYGRIRVKLLSHNRVAPLV